MKSLVTAAVVLTLEFGFLLGVAVLPEPSRAGVAAEAAARPAPRPTATAIASAAR